MYFQECVFHLRFESSIIKKLLQSYDLLIYELRSNLSPIELNAQKRNQIEN